MTSAELEQWLRQEIPQPEHVENIKKLLGMLTNTNYYSIVTGNARQYICTQLCRK